MGGAQNTERRDIENAPMARALELARRAEGQTAPNPMVGCIITKPGGFTAGRGWHKGAGQPHAEIEALREAGRFAEGATLYVTLEPCNHHGATPPCTEAILESGVAKVVYGMADPNPAAAGGAAYLREHGVNTVFTDIYEPQLIDLNRFWLSRIKRARPYVIGKFAMSLDGKIATKSGDSKWITGGKARDHAHLLRRKVDAIIAGAKTVIADDPSLTARNGDEVVGYPLRVILDSTGRTPPGAAVFDRAGRGALLATTARTPKARLDAYREHGVDIAVLDTDHHGRPDACALISALHERGVCGVLVEGGAEIHGSFLAADLYDEIRAYIAPVFIGGDGRAAIGPINIDKIADAFKAGYVETRQLGADMLLIARMTASKARNSVTTPMEHG